MWQLQVDNEQYSVYNWLNLISSSTAIYNISTIQPEIWYSHSR